MDTENIARAAELFGNAAITHTSLKELPAACTPRDQAEGFAVQDAVLAWLAEHGYGGVGGHKVGLVTPEIRASATGGDTDELGWDTPVYSGLIGSRIFRDTAVVPFGECIRPRIEGEFAVRIGADIPPEKAPFTKDSIGEYIDACMAGIEIVDWRMWYWDFAPPLGPLMLADICSNWGAIFSEGVTDWRSLDIPSLGATLTCNGEAISSGKAEALLGHPFEVLAWQANHMAERGRSIRQGAEILLGSVTVSYADFDQGAELIVAWDEIGEVRAKFT